MREKLARYVFEYDYSLMYGAPDNLHIQSIQDGKICDVSESLQDTECGRLTLKSLTYEVSYGVMMVIVVMMVGRPCLPSSSNMRIMN